MHPVSTRSIGVSARGVVVGERVSLAETIPLKGYTDVS